MQLGRYSSTLILAVPLPERERERERSKETIGGNLHESHCGHFSYLNLVTIGNSDVVKYQVISLYLE